MGVMDWALPAPNQPHGRQSVERPTISYGLANSFEQWCREAGWVLVEREADKYRVRNGDHRRDVYINVHTGGPYCNVLFQAWFSVRFSLEKPPAGVFARLLLRNLDLTWSGWSMSIGESCEACLCVSASFPVETMNGQLFSKVCEEIAEEIRSFHQELRDKFAYNMGTVVTDGPPQSRPGGLAPRPGGNVPGVRFLG